MSLLAPGPVLTHAQEARLIRLEDEDGAKVVGVSWEHGDPIVERAGGRLQRITEGGRMSPVLRVERLDRT